VSYFERETVVSVSLLTSDIQKIRNSSFENSSGLRKYESVADTINWVS
jgi:hypothetical protein